MDTTKNVDEIKASLADIRWLIENELRSLRKKVQHRPKKLSARDFPATGIARPMDVAEFLTVSQGFVYRMIEKGDLDLIRVGEKSIRTSWESVHAYRRGCERLATGKAVMASKLRAPKRPR